MQNFIFQSILTVLCSNEKSYIWDYLKFYRDISENPISLRYSEFHLQVEKISNVIADAKLGNAGSSLANPRLARRMQKRGGGEFSGVFRFSRVPCNNSLLNPRRPSVRPYGMTR